MVIRVIRESPAPELWGCWGSGGPQAVGGTRTPLLSPWPFYLHLFMSIYLFLFFFFFPWLTASPKSHFQKLTPPGVRASLRGAGGSQACDHLLSPISVRSLDSSGFDVLLTALLCSGPACHLGLAARHQPGSGEEEEEQQEPQQDAPSPVVHPAHDAQLTLQTLCPPYKPCTHPTNPVPTLQTLHPPCL